MTLPVSGSITIVIPVALYILPFSGSMIIPVLLSICCASTFCEKGYVVRKSGVRRIDEMIIADIVVLAIHCFFLIRTKVFIEIYYFLHVLFYHYVQFFT